VSPQPGFSSVNRTTKADFDEGHIGGRRACSPTATRKIDGINKNRLFGRHRIGRAKKASDRESCLDPCARRRRRCRVGDARRDTTLSVRDGRSAAFRSSSSSLPLRSVREGRVLVLRGNAFRQPPTSRSSCTRPFLSGGQLDAAATNRGVGRFSFTPVTPGSCGPSSTTARRRRPGSCRGPAPAATACSRRRSNNLPRERDVRRLKRNVNSSR
jgi:hypothetical protein